MVVPGVPATDDFLVFCLLVGTAREAIFPDGFALATDVIRGAPGLSPSCLDRADETCSEDKTLREEPLPFPVDTDEGKVVPELRGFGTRRCWSSSSSSRVEFVEEVVSASSFGGGGRMEGGDGRARLFGLVLRL